MPTPSFLEFFGLTDIDSVCQSVDDLVDSRFERVFLIDELHEINYNFKGGFHRGYINWAPRHKIQASISSSTPEAGTA